MCRWLWKISTKCKCVSSNRVFDIFMLSFRWKSQELNMRRTDRTLEGQKKQQFKPVIWRVHTIIWTTTHTDEVLVFIHYLFEIETNSPTVPKEYSVRKYYSALVTWYETKTISLSFNHRTSPTWFIQRSKWIDMM